LHQFKKKQNEITPHKSAKIKSKITQIQKEKLACAKGRKKDRLLSIYKKKKRENKKEKCAKK